MVWTTEQSPLYRSVAAHNEAAGRHDCAPEQEDSAGKAACAPPPQNQPGGCDCRRSSRGGLLQKLTGDSDQLLIIALILLLLHEKADMKLIAALVFVLLS